MRNALFSQQQPGGMFAILDNRMTTGNIFFVNSATGTDAAGYGKNPDAPFATINYALTQCTNANGDQVYVMPGHTEAVGAAGGITFSHSGVRVIGLGIGRSRPIITLGTATTATIAMSSAYSSLENMVIDCTGFDAVVAPIKVTAGDCTIKDCEIVTGFATAQATSGITTTAAADRLTVENCLFRATSDAGTEAAIIIVGGDGHIIQDNVFIGAYSSGVGAIENKTTACTNAIVLHNTIRNLTAGCTKAMVFVTGATGQISENYMQILAGTAPITGDAMSWVGANYYAAVIATAGTLI
jgi:hypothetical protein